MSGPGDTATDPGADPATPVAALAGEPVAIALPSGEHVGGRRWGEGPVGLVFFHANGFCASTYAPLLAPVAEAVAGRTVLALDLRGHGRTTIAADPARFDRWTLHRDDMIGALAQLDGTLAPGGPVLAGHSMGGTTALLMAARAPELARALVLFDPVFAPASFYLLARLPGAFSYWRRNFPIARAALRRRRDFASRAEAEAAYRGRGAFSTWQDGFLEAFLRDGLKDHPSGPGLTLACSPEMEASCFAGQRHDPHQALRQLATGPTVLAAERNSTFRARVSEQIEAAGGTVTVVAGTSHFLPMERPDLASLALIAAMLRPT